MEHKENEIHVVKEKYKKVEELKELGLEPYGRYFDKKDSIASILENDENCEKTFKTAGRIMSYRKMGKNGFAHIQDITGKVQIYAKKELEEDEMFETFKKLAIGDFIGIEGTLFRTKTRRVNY